MVYFKKLREDAIIPTRGTPRAAGVDLYACLDKFVCLEPGESAIIGTGIAWMPSPNRNPSCVKSMVVKSRSGLAFKHDIESSNAGVIDEDYRGEIKVKVYNRGNTHVTIEHGQRFAQGLIISQPLDDIIEYTGELDTTERGEGGFGSTGK